MATKLRHAGRALPPPTILPTPPSLDDEFLTMIVRIAATPLRSADQPGEGAIHLDGLDAQTIRRLALAWCDRMVARNAFDRDELQGLRLALEHFTHAELVDLIKGAIAVGHG